MKHCAKTIRRRINALVLHYIEEEKKTEQMKEKIERNTEIR